ncbi:MAG: hypothetical protein LC799_08195, partial [Actinobacteria bacterium]|nr:hypothetical protein [Actinomycetota bacterium]
PWAVLLCRPRGPATASRVAKMLPFGPRAITDDMYEVETRRNPEYVLLSTAFPCGPGPKPGAADWRAKKVVEIFCRLILHKPYPIG